MKTQEWVKELFQVVDAGDADGFVTFLTDDAIFTFGNRNPVKGKTAIRETVAGFFASIKSLDHTVLESWVHPDSVLCRGTVTYTRHDSSQLTVPFVNILKTEGERIKEYLIFIDVSELYS